MVNALYFHGEYYVILVIRYNLEYAPKSGITGSKEKYIKYIFYYQLSMKLASSPGYQPFKSLPIC